MTRLHIRFRDFHAGTMEATEALFNCKPWQFESDFERQAVAQVWADTLCEIYEVPAVRVVVGESHESDSDETHDALDDFEDVPGEATALMMDHWSLVILFKRFREHMLANGYSPQNRYPEDDVLGWAYSLFYKVRPRMFRARVREGRIPRVTPDDLLTTETLRRRAEENEEREAEQIRAEMQEATEATFEDVELPEAASLTPYQILARARADGISDETLSETEFVARYVDIEQMTRDDLRKLAAERNIAGRGTMTKAQLVEALR